MFITTVMKIVEIICSYVSIMSYAYLYLLMSITIVVRMIFFIHLNNLKNVLGILLLNILLVESNYLKKPFSSSKFLLLRT